MKGTGARRVSDLAVWRMGNQLRRTTFAITRRREFKTDLKAKGQMDDAARSVCRNIAEGFGCVSHAEFARYLEISQRSLNELMDAFKAAVQQDYMDEAELVPIRSAAGRLFRAIGRFREYLLSTPTPPSFGRSRSRKGETRKGLRSTKKSHPSERSEAQSTPHPRERSDAQGTPHPRERSEARAPAPRTRGRRPRLHRRK
jgi:four helix bundle protein